MQFQQTAAFKELFYKESKSTLIRHAKLLSYKPEQKIVLSHRSVGEIERVKLPTLIAKKQQFQVDHEKTKELIKNLNIKLIRQKIEQNVRSRKISQHEESLNLTFGKNFRIKTRPLLSRQENSIDLRDSHSASRVMSHSQQRLVNKLFQ